VAREYAFNPPKIRFPFHLARNVFSMNLRSLEAPPSSGDRSNRATTLHIGVSSTAPEQAGTYSRASSPKSPAAPRRSVGRPLAISLAAAFRRWFADERQLDCEPNHHRRSRTRSIAFVISGDFFQSFFLHPFSRLCNSIVSTSTDYRALIVCVSVAPHGQHPAR
jgi:hypothetical protein